MMMSPSDSKPARVSTVAFVGSPEGTMIHTARGGSKPRTSPTRSSAHCAPSAPQAATMAGFRS
jgi:hypothetical protein